MLSIGGGNFVCIYLNLLDLEVRFHVASDESFSYEKIHPSVFFVRALRRLTKMMEIHEKPSFDGNFVMKPQGHLVS